MSRGPRLLSPDGVYHIITRGNNQNTVFKEDEDFIFYLKLLAKFKKEQPFDLFHYCLMSNHTHLLLQTNKNTNLSLLMKRLNLSYFHYFRRKYGWVGHFWQDRFRTQLVSKDEYLIQCGKYIELNPVRAEIVRSPEDYSWSSYRYYGQGINGRLITPNIFYEELGKNAREKQKNYRNLIIEEMNFKNKKSSALGSPHFVYNVNRKRKYHLFHKQASYRKSPG